MRWKTLFGMLAVVGSALALFAHRRRRIDVEKLGPVSQAWLAEHIADDRE